MNGLPKIERLHAWIVVDDDGTEGIPAINLPGLGPTPMMCGDMPGAVAAFEKTASDLVGHLGKNITHYVFEGRSLVQAHHP